MTTRALSASAEHAICAAAAIVANVALLHSTPIQPTELNAAIAAAIDGVLIGSEPHELKIKNIFVSAMADIFRTVQEVKSTQAALSVHESYIALMIARSIDQ
jgi:hypothetical protein